MKVTLIRTDKEHGKEALSTCETGALFEKIKTETKSGHITALRNILPALEGTHSQYEHIDKLPRIYPAVEYTASYCPTAADCPRKKKKPPCFMPMPTVWL